MEIKKKIKFKRVLMRMINNSKNNKKNLLKMQKDKMN